MKLLIIFSINRIATPILVYYFVLSILSLYSSLSLSLCIEDCMLLYPVSRIFCTEYALENADKYKSYISPPPKSVSAKPPFDGSRRIRVRVIPAPANQNGSL